MGAVHRRAIFLDPGGPEQGFGAAGRLYRKQVKDLKHGAQIPDRGPDCEPAAQMF